MANLAKLFSAQKAYVDEDGYLSFNPKYGKNIGVVITTNIELDQDYTDIASFQDEKPKYITGIQSYTATCEIRIMAETLDLLDYDNKLNEPKLSNKLKKPKKTKKSEIEKDKVEGPFAFLDIKD